MKDFDFNEIIGDIENNKLNRVKSDIYLSNKDIEVLKRYDIDYMRYNNMSSLIFEIEELLNEGYGNEDLENLSLSLQEFNYYNNTNK